VQPGGWAAGPLKSCRAGLASGEVDVGSRDVVEIVGEDVRNHLSDSLDDVGVCQPCVPRSRQVGIGDRTPRRDDGSCELQDRCGARIVGPTLEMRVDRLGRNFQAGRDRGMRRGAVVASVGTGNGALSEELRLLCA
jgi:hypothetical protein